TKQGQGGKGQGNSNHVGILDFLFRALNLFRISDLGFRILSYLMRFLLISIIRLYQLTLSRFVGGHCRFQPTCSQYAIDAINKYGPFRGSWRAIKRLLRCHPFGGSGWDPA
ncbi:MAG TPA: membrane protein insertion efficiency factor YidD, partial [Tepidisphaeraceae bacterium]